MKTRARGRLLVVTSALGLAHLAFVGCGGSDEVKRAMDDGGAAGEDGEPSSGGSSAGRAGNATGGSLTPSGGAAGSAGNSGTHSAGAGGLTDLELGGASGAAPVGGESGAAGASEGGAGASTGENGGAGGAGETACVTEGSRISIAFDAENAEWVTNLQWLNSANVLIPNVAASGGTSTCGDPPEFFGEAYGAPEGTTPWVVVAGSRSSAVACGLDIDIGSTPQNCLAAAQIPTSTQYHFYKGAQASQMRVTRRIGFDENTPVFSGVGVRPWQPRVVLATWANVIYPNAAGTAVTTKAALSCPGDCIIPTGETWNGQWFADVAADGHAIIVRRDPALTSAVSLTVNYDSYSSANLASFVVLQPQAGWKAPITEVEYLCFADLTSWPQTERDAAQLPTWCGP